MNYGTCFGCSHDSHLQSNKVMLMFLEYTTFSSGLKEGEKTQCVTLEKKRKIRSILVNVDLLD